MYLEVEPSAKYRTLVDLALVEKVELDMHEGTARLYCGGTPTISDSKMAFDYYANGAPDEMFAQPLEWRKKAQGK